MTLAAGGAHLGSVWTGLWLSPAQTLVSFVSLKAYCVGCRVGLGFVRNSQLCNSRLLCSRFSLFRTRPDTLSIYNPVFSLQLKAIFFREVRRLVDYSGL